MTLNSFLRNKRLWLVALLLVALALPLLLRFWPENAPTSPPSSPTPVPAKQVNVPLFQADSAFYFVEKQVAFGPRVPGTAAHKKCAAWLVKEFKRFGLEVIEQPFVAKTYFGLRDAVNIIAQYHPERANRILLCAHWDSRHIADKDSVDTDKPILGADDGGSGVAVLLELARLLQQHPLERVGVDFVLFDAEDLGDDRTEAGQSVMLQAVQDQKTLTWCLGSQHWARTPHRPGYTAQFGILLDMVGARGALFPREGYSAQQAPVLQNRIWAIAQELGYGNLFIDRLGGYITDDHVFVMRGLRIPVVNIIGIPNSPPAAFGAHHHTHRDNLEVIDRNILGVVGHVVATVLYRAAAGAF
ncbi:MAG: M28 family peptidase [Saprospiraceae bacterium]|nr:M28 family peptidase [Saprospiraceae bacterium]MDW8483425.1 M28 family peptidase [Saprospiraceae bacterium]